MAPKSRRHKQSKRNDRSPPALATAPTRADLPHHRPWTLGPVLLLVALVVAAVQWPVLDAQAWCFDDGEYLLENELVRYPSWTHAGRFLSEVLEPSTVHGYYQPLTMISLMADVAMGGTTEDFTAFHRTSLMLHIANAVLITVLMYQLFGHVWAAGAAGVLFGVHPMTVEVIAWLSERKTLLATFFALIALVSYVRYTHGRRLGWYLTMAVAFVLALMSKPTSTPLPVCMLLMDVWPLRRLSRRAIIEKLLLLAIAVVSAIITYESQRRTAITVLPGDSASRNTALIMAHNIVYYLRQMIVPVNLTSHHPFPMPFNLSNMHVWLGVIGSAMWLGILVLSLRWTRALAVGWLWFFLAIFPTLGVIGFTNVIAAEKYAYLPAVGMLMIGTAAVTWFLRDARFPARHQRRMLTGGVVAAAAILASVGTRAYLELWTSTEGLFRYMITLAPNGAAPHDQLAAEYARRGRHREAIEQLKRVIAIQPNVAMPYVSMGNAYRELGQRAKAIEWFRRTLALDPDHPRAHNNLANLLLEAGRLDEAVAHYRKAIEANSANDEAHYNLANVLVRQGHPAEAITHYRRAIAINPGLSAAHNNLANVLWQQGHHSEAMEHFTAALKHRPDWWQLAMNLAWLCADRKNAEVYDPARAIRFAERATALTERRNPAVLAALAVAHAEAGDRTRAHQIAHEAIALARQLNQPQLADEITQRMNSYSP